MLERAEEIRVDKGQLKLWGPCDEHKARCGHTYLEPRHSGSEVGEQEFRVSLGYILTRRLT